MGKAKTGQMHTCGICGTEFYLAGWEIKAGRRHCSKSCGYVGRLRLPTKTEAERFWPKVSKQPDGCWVWTGARHGGSGYGSFSLTQMPGTAKRNVVAHRWSYENANGPVPDGLELDHLCRNRLCVRPEHLEPVTRSTNVRRGISGDVNGSRQRGKTHCPQGHAYDTANTYVRKSGARQCRACGRIARAERLAKVG